MVGGVIKIIDYPADFCIFDNPQVLDIRLEPGELLRWNVIATKVDMFRKQTKKDC